MVGPLSKTIEGTMLTATCSLRGTPRSVAKRRVASQKMDVAAAVAMCCQKVSQTFFLHPMLIERAYAGVSRATNCAGSMQVEAASQSTS